MTYEQIEARRKRIGVSRAAMCRRADVSDSTISKGLKLKRQPISAISSRLMTALDEIANERAVAAHSMEAAA